MMALPNVIDVIPAFRRADDWERDRSGLYVCQVCPLSKSTHPQQQQLRDSKQKQHPSRPAFRGTKAALSHDASSSHVEHSNAAERVRKYWAPWEYNQDPADWTVEAMKDPKRVPEHYIRQIEHCERIEALPSTVAHWQTGIKEHVSRGTLLSPDAPPSKEPLKAKVKNTRSTRRKRKAAKAKKEAALADTEERVNGVVQKEQIEEEIRSDDEQDGMSDCSNVNAPFSSNNSIKTSSELLHPDMKQWIADMEILLNISPSRIRQLREFAELPTVDKTEVIRDSVYQLRSLVVI